VAIDDAPNLRQQVKTARSRIRSMSEMLRAARALDHDADEEGPVRSAEDSSGQGAYLLALALDLCATNTATPRAVAEILEVSHGSPMALLGARSRATALQRELPDDRRARDVVDLLTGALRRARVDAFSGPNAT
jgi:hypothetical protein